jgi:hypothetical protein
MGSCVDTSDITYDLLKPVNDDISNAILLPYGKSEYYTNICASVENNEPVPPVTSCTAQDSWCDEYGTGEDIVENSVWFKFIADTGKVSISSVGFDNQIALYKAASYSDILSGNYTLIAANDDRTETNFRPLITGVDVVAGDTYWIQVDGSGGGLEDDFYLTITQYSATPTEQIESGNLRIYPQPAKSVVMIQNPKWTNDQVGLMLYNAAGLCLFNGKVPVSGSEISIDLSMYAAGIYVATIHHDNLLNVVKIIRE